MLLAILVKQKATLSFDRFVYDAIITYQSKRTTFFFNQITQLASGVFVFALSLILFFINRQIGKWCFINMLANSVLNQVCKLIFVRERPSLLHLTKVSGYSFPSGHAMMSMAVYGLLIYFVYQSSLHQTWKYLLYTIFTMIILLVGFSRIYLGVHYASDVLGGYLLSFIYLLLFIRFSLKERYLL